jgi:adenylate/guanylate cyclase family protein
MCAVLPTSLKRQPEEVSRRLNGIFDCLGDPVRAAGGEILKFLGDGALAVFLPPDGANVAVVTFAALAAARETLARVEALNASETAAGNPALSLNIALHAGEVTYGNIGTADRLDFTVIGPAVNQAARLEKLVQGIGDANSDFPVVRAGRAGSARAIVVNGSALAQGRARSTGSVHHPQLIGSISARTRFTLREGKGRARPRLPMRRVGPLTAGGAVSAGLRI